MSDVLRETQASPADRMQDVAQRPQHFREFVGQEKLCHNLEVFIVAAKARQEALDHTLLSGPPGLGKTTLAQIIARELQVNFRATAGPVISKTGELAALLTNLDARDVLFIDEIHRLHPAIEEILYAAMEDFQLDVMIGEGPAARSIKIDLPPFTLVGATTRAGLLTTPLRDRFGIPLYLDFYGLEELEEIIHRHAALLHVQIDLDGAKEIARRARGTPRLAGRFLRRVRDFAAVQNAPRITAKVAAAALEKLDVDACGLDGLDHKYLRVIGEKFSGGPVGIDTIAAALSEQRDVLEDVVEPFLIQQGFVARTVRGRILHNAAYKHLGLTPPKATTTRNANAKIDLFALSPQGDTPSKSERS